MTGQENDHGRKERPDFTTFSSTFFLLFEQGALHLSSELFFSICSGGEKILYYHILGAGCTKFVQV